MGGELHRLLGEHHRASSSRAPGSTRSAPPRPAAPPASPPTPSTASPAASIRRAVVPGLELATQLILELCGGEAVGDPSWPAKRPRPPGADRLRPRLCEEALGPRRRARRGSTSILSNARLRRSTGDRGHPAVLAPRRGRQGRPRRGSGPHRGLRRPARRAPARGRPAARRRADPAPGAASRNARRALAARGHAEAVTWSFTAPRQGRSCSAAGDERLVLTNPIASDLRLHAALDPAQPDRGGRPQRPQGLPDAALFEVGPIYPRRPARPTRRRRSAAVLAPHPPRHWDGRRPTPLFELKADLLALLEELGAPTLQAGPGPEPRPGGIPAARRACSSAPRPWSPSSASCIRACSRRWTSRARSCGFELNLDAMPEPKKKAVKTKPALELSALMPLARDFAFVVAADDAGGRPGPGRGRRRQGPDRRARGSSTSTRARACRRARSRWPSRCWSSRARRPSPTPRSRPCRPSIVAAAEKAVGREAAGLTLTQRAPHPSPRGGEGSSSPPRERLGWRGRRTGSPPVLERQGPLLRLKPR